MYYMLSCIVKYCSEDNLIFFFANPNIFFFFLLILIIIFFLLLFSFFLLLVLYICNYKSVSNKPILWVDTLWINIT